MYKCSRVHRRWPDLPLCTDPWSHADVASPASRYFEASPYATEHDRTKLGRQLRWWLMLLCITAWDDASCIRMHKLVTVPRVSLTEYIGNLRGRHLRIQFCVIFIARIGIWKKGYSKGERWQVTEMFYFLEISDGVDWHWLDYCRHVCVCLRAGAFASVCLYICVSSA
jgi:hypothetical protein